MAMAMQLPDTLRRLLPLALVFALASCEEKPEMRPIESASSQLDQIKHRLKQRKEEANAKGPQAAPASPAPPARPGEVKVVGPGAAKVGDFVEYQFASTGAELLDGRAVEVRSSCRLRLQAIAIDGPYLTVLITAARDTPTLSPLLRAGLRVRLSTADALPRTFVPAERASVEVSGRSFDVGTQVLDDSAGGGLLTVERAVDEPAVALGNGVVFAGTSGAPFGWSLQLDVVGHAAVPPGAADAPLAFNANQTWRRRTRGRLRSFGPRTSAGAEVGVEGDLLTLLDYARSIVRRGFRLGSASTSKPVTFVLADGHKLAATLVTRTVGVSDARPDGGAAPATKATLQYVELVGAPPKALPAEAFVQPLEDRRRGRTGWEVVDRLAVVAGAAAAAAADASPEKDGPGGVEGERVPVPLSSHGLPHDQLSTAFERASRLARDEPQSALELFSLIAASTPSDQTLHAMALSRMLELQRRR